MVGTILAALLLTLLTVSVNTFPWSETGVFLTLTVLGALAHLYPIRSAHSNQAIYVLDNTFLFAAVMLLSPGWLALLNVGVWVPVTIRRYLDRKPEWLLQPAANAGQALLASIPAHLAMAGWLPSLTPAPIDIAILFSIILAFVLFQTGWVAVVFHFAHGLPLTSPDFWNRDALLGEVVLLCLGAILALIWIVHPGLTALVMVPVAGAYHLMRNVQLIRLGELDGKTGLYNARRFEEQFQRTLATAKLLHQPFSLIFFDLDFLRNINNNHGHLAGDAVIQGVAQRIREGLRSGDFAARFGGEEFVLLLPGTEANEGHWVAERIRQAVADTPFDIGGGKQLQCSISGGVAAFPLHGSSVAALTEAADQALYRAKGQGRNQVCIAGEFPCSSGSDGDRSELRPELAVAAALQVPEATEPATPAAVPKAPPVAKAAEAPPPSAPATVAPPANTIELILILAGAAGLGITLWFHPGGHNFRLLAGLMTLGFAVEYFKVELLRTGGSRASVSFGAAVTVATAVTLGMFAAVSVNIANFLAHVLLAKRRSPVNLAGNLSMMVLAAMAGSLPFTVGRAEAANDFRSLAAVMAASLLYFVTNFGLVSIVTSHHQKTTVAAFWRQHGWVAPSYLLTTVCGGLMGIAYHMGGWLSLPVFILPLLMMRQTYQTHLRRMEEAYAVAKQGQLALQEGQAMQRRAMDQLMEAVSTIIDVRDASVFGHSGQVARYAVALAEELQLPEAEVTQIRRAALLHDLGKMGIPEAILHKPAKLTSSEWAVMRKHTEIGKRILQGIAGFAETARMVGEHHEKFNGTGYPRGLAGEAISLGARIIALADALDTILSDRPYSRARPLAWAVTEIVHCAGEHFDPTVVEAFQRLVAKRPVDFFVNSAKQGPSDPWVQVAAAEQS